MYLKNVDRLTAAAGSTWDGVTIPATTATLTGATGVATATGFNLFNISAPTITDASAVTVTNAASVYIGGAPAAAGSATITNAYSLWIDNGVTRMDGLVNVGLGTTASTNAVCSSLANATAPTAGTAYELRDCNAAPAADFAEQYPVAKGVDVGDVVMQGQNQVPTYEATTDNSDVDWTRVKGNISQLVKATTAYDASLIGVVSDNTMDFVSTGYNIRKSDNPKSIALNGRVNVKITTENGTIAPGDFLTASAARPGYAMKATRAGYVIGQALSSFDGATPGVVMTFVRTQYYPGPVPEAPLLEGNFANLNATGAITTMGLNVTGVAHIHELTVDGAAQLAELNVTGTATVGSLVVNGGITTRSIIVAETAQVSRLVIATSLALGTDTEDPTTAGPHPITKRFKAAAALAVGTVVIADARTGYVTTTTAAGDKRVVGVVTTAATAADQSIEVAIGGTALANIGGSSSIGQLVQTAATAGRANTATNPATGALLGKVLGTADVDGLTLILVSLQ